MKTQIVRIVTFLTQYAQIKTLQKVFSQETLGFLS